MWQLAAALNCSNSANAVLLVLVPWEPTTCFQYPTKETLLPQLNRSLDTVRGVLTHPNARRCPWAVPTPSPS